MHSGLAHDFGGLLGGDRGQLHIFFVVCDLFEDGHLVFT